MEPIGAVFTPLTWARFAVAKAGLVHRWLAGATILDPTAGTGTLLQALVEEALDQGNPVQALPFHRLHSVEIDPNFRDQAVLLFAQKYSVGMAAQFVCADLFEIDPIRYDIVLGNPPWVNFADLPEAEKPGYKRRFLASGLISDTRKLLLGGSRLDLAALFVQTVLERHVAQAGEAWFFLPLSLFLNEGAHGGFRSYRAGGRPFAVLEVFDFGAEGVFPGISTRHGLVRFAVDRSASFPIPYSQRVAGQWTNREAFPAFRGNDPLSVGEVGRLSPWSGWKPLRIEERSRPRQGINTGGCNEIFLLRHWEPAGPGLGWTGTAVLPSAFVHPLMTSEVFRDGQRPPERWVLLPHETDGRPVSPVDLPQYPELHAYLMKHRAALEGRRGALLAGWRRRGMWWALLGVGPYSFAPYKVMWEAYGRHQFRPVVKSGEWQANQALQAFIPCWSLQEGERVLEALQSPEVESFLASTNTAGSKSWAQPGQIRRLLQEI